MMSRILFADSEPHIRQLCQEELQDFWGAYAAYNAVKRHKPSKNLYFDAVLASATMALGSDSVALGMKILETLSKDKAYFTQIGEIHLRTADGYYLEHQIDKAIELYNQVTVQNPKTQESAEAYYRLGLIYQSDKFDLDAAKDAFSKAQTESPTSEFRYLALARSAQIAKLESYRAQLQKADSVRALGAINSLGPPDSSSGAVPDKTPGFNIAGSMKPGPDTNSVMPGSSKPESPSTGMNFIGPLPELPMSAGNTPGVVNTDSAGISKVNNSKFMGPQPLPNEIGSGQLKSGIDSSAIALRDSSNAQRDKGKNFIGPLPENLNVVDSKFIGPVPLPNEISPARTGPGADSLAMASRDSLRARADRLKGFIGPLPEDLLAKGNQQNRAMVDSLRNSYEGKPGFIGPRFQDVLVNNDLPKTTPADSLGRIGQPRDSSDIQFAQIAQSDGRPGGLTAPPGRVNEDSVRQAILDSGIETRYLLAELFAYELNSPDSALQEYLYIVSEYPQSNYAPRALLAAAQIELGRADSSEALKYPHRLVSEYPRTPQAVLAAELLSNPLDLSENAVGLYTAAESLVFSANMPDSAYALYKYVADKFPDMAPQASYAAAWVLDQVIGVEDSSAYYAYQDVARKYPQTAYGQAANDRLKGSSGKTDKPRSTTRQEQPEQQPEEQQPDTTTQLAEGLPFAPAVKTPGVFNYPEALYSRDLKGKVTFKIKIDVTGKVRDHEIIGPSGEYAIDSSATAIPANVRPSPTMPGTTCNARRTASLGSSRARNSACWSSNSSIWSGVVPASARTRRTISSVRSTCLPVSSSSRGRVNRMSRFSGWP